MNSDVETADVFLRHGNAVIILKFELIFYSKISNQIFCFADHENDCGDSTDEEGCRKSHKPYLNKIEI
jgi:hypothetical protein